MHKKLCNIIILNWGEYNEAINTVQRISNFIGDQKNLSSVEYTNRSLDDIKLLVNMLKNRDYIYTDESDIKSSYNIIKNQIQKKNEVIIQIEKNGNQDLLKNLKSYRTIYIPSNIMVIPVLEKEFVKPENVGRYKDIKFYQNEYKRIVLWHLSVSQNIYFYKK